MRSAECGVRSSEPRVERRPASRITPHASRTTHHASRITHHASRITHHAPRITHHTSRLTHHASRLPHHALQIPPNAAFRAVLLARRAPPRRCSPCTHPALMELAYR